MPGFTPAEQRRIDLTCAVRDCDSIPKVADAGTVREVDGGLAQVMHNGVLVEMGGYYGPWVAEIIRRLRGHHEPQEEVAFHALIERLAQEPEAPVMVELGAYWAYYSLWMLYSRPDARVVCVEPDPEHLRTGERNFALNGRSGRFVHAAVGARHGGRKWMESESDGRVRLTPVVSLEGLMADERLARVDLVLCDAQGVETEVLQASQALLRSRRVRFLVISTHHWSFSGDPLTHQRCLALLREAGAHVIVDHTVMESCSGDGLIVASTDPRDRDLEIEVTYCRARDSLFGELDDDLAWALRPSAPARRAWGRLVTAVGRRRRRVRA
jgi:FkbM family methyltransferase